MILKILYRISAFSVNPSAVTTLIATSSILQLTFTEIWLHTLLAICSFGWGAYFQNWIFALLAAVFLPTFNPENFNFLVIF